MAIDTELAKRLRSYRNFKHLTQKDVAAHLNVPHSAISDIENGKRDITVSELKVFSNLYGRSVEEIMSGKKYDYYNIANIFSFIILYAGQSNYLKKSTKLWYKTI